MPGARGKFLSAKSRVAEPPNLAQSHNLFHKVLHLVPERTICRSADCGLCFDISLTAIFRRSIGCRSPWSFGEFMERRCHRTLAMGPREICGRLCSPTPNRPDQPDGPSLVPRVQRHATPVGLAQVLR
jgi:hypothetical protein